MRFIANRNIEEWVVAGITIIAVALGIWMRLSGAPEYLTDNISTYYFHHSRFLLEQGSLPERDIWSFAPYAAAENIAPLFAYATVGAFTIVSFLPSLAGYEVDFMRFAVYAPVLFFLAWAASLTLVLRLFGRAAFFAGLMLLTFLPFSITLTSAGNYSEETVGAPLFFLTVFFLIKYLFDGRSSSVTMMSVFAMLLALSWAQFPGAFVAIMLVALVEAIFGNRRAAWAITLAIAASLVFGHAIAVYLMSVEYSPILMLGEALRGLLNFQNPDLRLAMWRTSWVRPGFLDIWKSFGMIGMVTFLLGMTLAFRTRAPADRALIIAGIIAAALYLSFTKSSALFLPVLVLVAAYGAKNLYREWDILRFR